MRPFAPTWHGLIRRLRRGPEASTASQLGPVLQRIQPGRLTNVAVIGGSGQRAETAAWLGREHPGAKVLELPTGRTSHRHVAMTAAGPFDLVIDLTTRPAGALRRLKDLHFHVRPQGTLLMRGVAPTADARGSAQRKLARFLAEVESSRGSTIPFPAKGHPLGLVDARAMAATTSAIDVVSGDLLVRSSAHAALAKLDESEFSSYVESRPDDGLRVVHRIPARSFTSACVLRRGADPTPVQPETYEPPDLVLRQYDGALIAPGQVVTHGRLMLPDTFRHNARRRIRNDHVVELAPRFAALPALDQRTHELAGDWFHLDNEVRGHFGHLITETLSRVWAWPLARAQCPELKVVVGTGRRPDISSWEYRLYEAAGIDRNDVEMITGPTRVERLWSSTPMLSHPEYVHPDIIETWRRVGDHLATDAEDIDYPERIFVSRRLNKRACHNIAEVENLFAARGFSVVYPEDYSLGTQVEMFRRAEVVSGFSGSGVFQLCFTLEPKEVILVRSAAYNARNEYLFGSLLGHRITELISEPDQPFFQSPFTFDLDREGRELTTVFERLGL